jgi:hypothetical protein
VDPTTIPENFHVPSKTSWEFVLNPLQNLYFDIPFAAQRAVSGVVYIDLDGDQQFDLRKDSVVAGARVVVGASETVSNENGLYLLRNLPAGAFNLRVYSRAGKPLGGVSIELGPEPALRTHINLRITPVGESTLNYQFS